MRKDLQDKLYKKYPKIFKQRKLHMTQTAMCWGIDTSDGWYKIIEILCEMLQWDIDHNKHEQIEASQVKEKFGTLRFYVSGSDAKQDGMIEFAEYLSGITCEECGSMNNVKQTKGWIYTRCADCMKKLEK